MKLKLLTPRNDVDDTFIEQIILEDSDDQYLRNKGFAYSEEKGYGKETLCWHGNIVMGDEPIHPVRGWRMYLPDRSILIID